MTLHLYFARRFGWWLAICFFTIYALVAIVDLVDQTRRFADRGATATGLFELVLLNTPETLQQILPLIVLVSTVAFFVSLARSSELVATRASGRSALKTLVAPVVVALAVGIFATTTLNPIVAATSKTYSERAQSYRSGGVSTLSISSEGLWLRQGSEEGQMVIQAWRSNPDASVLYDVTFLAYSPAGVPYRRIEADSAELRSGEWHLRNVKDWPLERGTNSEARAATRDTLQIPSSLTLDGIRESFGHPRTVSIWKLNGFIAQLDSAGISSLQHRVWLQSEIAKPLFLVAMVLIASGFTMRHSRFGGTGLAVVTVILLGFALYFIRSFALILGENGQLQVSLAVWAPPIASILLAFGPLLHTEDG